MTTLSREIVFLILQFLEEGKFKDTMHMLEQESGFFFNIKYFEEKVLAGEWDDGEKYLFGFTKFDDNQNSSKIFFEIRKQKYLEALDREDERSSIYDHDAKLARNILLLELKKLIQANPHIQNKLTFPSLKASRLQTLLNQSLNWQHKMCKNPKAKPDMKTLFIDHTCSPRNVTLPGVAVAQPSSHALLGAHARPLTLVPEAHDNANPLTTRMMMNANPPTFAHSLVDITSIGLMDCQNNDPSKVMQLMKRLRFGQSVDEVPQQASRSLDDLPRTIVCTLQQGSTVTSMDFNPLVHSLLAVGCANGELSFWEAGMRQKLISKPFKIWNIFACSNLFQAATVKDSSISISCVAWSPHGDFIGVAFTKHLIQLYVYQEPINDLQNHLEIDAHVGAVNDLAFSYPNNQLCIVTCGDDKLIKVWDLTGQKVFNFEGHGAPVYSVFPRQKGNVQFIVSTALDGKIKVWFYGNMISNVDYDDAPGKWCTKMLYSDDGRRLFSCGTSEDGYSFLVEWNQSEGTLKRTYSGFSNKYYGIVQFDTTKSRFLAAGEDKQIKFWDMDNINVLTTTNAEGGLSNLPRLRFNKEGNLLAVTTANGGLKILANADGIRFLRSFADQSYEAYKAPIEIKNNGQNSIARSIEKKISLDDGFKVDWESKEIIDHVQCRTIAVPDGMGPNNKVASLLYTNSGTGLLALGTKGIQKLWKWSSNELNPSGQVTTSVVPEQWISNCGILMTNDVSDNSELVFPCMALSKNDFYAVVACGGKISLLNMMTFKVILTFMSPPPVSTFFVLHPQDNNIIAIGMSDSTILIYNVKENEVKYKLNGHQRHITGLAFSTTLNILVSSSADAQLFLWSMDSWEKKKSLSNQMAIENAPVGDTRVQFHTDQVTLLVWHENQLAIYDASKMELLRQWVPQDGLSGSVSSATYSYNSQLVYAAFTDGSIRVFDADSLGLKCRIASSAYLHQTSPNSQNEYPVVVAAHPQEPNQFAIGLSDGSIKVIEPTMFEGMWGIKVPVNDGM